MALVGNQLYLAGKFTNVGGGASGLVQAAQLALGHADLHRKRRHGRLQLATLHAPAQHAASRGAAAGQYLRRERAGRSCVRATPCAGLHRPIPAFVSSSPALVRRPPINRPSPSGQWSVPLPSFLRRQESISQ